jgi:hypothetical protein
VSKFIFAAAVLAAADFEPIRRNVCFMAAPADYLDVSDLKAVLAGGLIREDVAQDIFDISDIPTP